MTAIRKVCSLVLAALLAPALATPAALAAPKAAPKAAKPTPARLYRMQAFLAYEPAWYDQRRVVFFGSRQAGAPVGVYVWEPATNKLARLTDAPTKLHSLAVQAGRVAFVEQGAKEPPAEAADPFSAALLPQPGPETIWVQAAGTTKFQAIFRGWVLPKSLAWSPAGDRLAFVTLDRRGLHRLALLTPGQAPVLVQLDQEYEFGGLVGWASDQEVVVRVKPLVGGPERLLQVGRSGIQPYLDANEPRISPNGQWLLVKDWENRGLYLRSLAGAGRGIAQAASAYAWAPGSDRIVYAAGRDVVAADPAGKVIARWPGAADRAVGAMVVSPDGRLVALDQEGSLTVLQMR